MRIEFSGIFEEAAVHPVAVRRYKVCLVNNDEVEGIQFVFMDWGPESKAVFFPETRAFLSQALKSELPSVIVCHQHVKPVGSRWLDSFIANDAVTESDVLTLNL